MSSEQVERLSNRQFVRREIRRISQASTTEEKIALEEGLENYIVDKLNQLKASQQENERLRETLEIIRPVLRYVSWADSEPVYPRSQFSLNRAADRWKVIIEDYPELVEWTRGNDAALEEQEAQDAS